MFFLSCLQWISLIASTTWCDRGFTVVRLLTFQLRKWENLHNLFFLLFLSPCAFFFFSIFAPRSWLNQCTISSTMNYNMMSIVIELLINIMSDLYDTVVPDMKPHIALGGFNDYLWFIVSSLSIINDSMFQSTFEHDTFIDWNRSFTLYLPGCQ